MKKRVAALLMALVMLVGLLPSAVWAEVAVTPVSTAAELAALGGKQISGSYKLTADIDMTGQTMQPIKKFSSGTFDGQGHTISGLTIAASSGNTGLFAETGSGAVIQGIVLQDANVSLSSGSYVGVGALVGRVSGATEIRECGVSGSVSTSSSSALYVGGLVGYVYEKTTVDGCYGAASVTGGSYSNGKVGGLIGYTYSAADVSNCYVTGEVTSKGAAAGALGYFSTSSSNKVTLTNCYAACDVGGSASYRYPFAYIYSNYLTATNCLYESGRESNKDNTQSGITAASADELKAAAGTLGDAFRADLSAPINGGYPILRWQYVDPNATYTVTIRVEPADSVLTWNGEEQPVSADGNYTFSDVAVGSYAYSVANSGDYAAKSGTVTVRSGDVTETVTLAANTHKLTFTGLPEGAALTVMSGDQTLTPDADGVYTVVGGTYTYTATAFGYDDLSGSVTVGREDTVENIAMQARAVVTVTFTYDKTPQSPQLTVAAGERVMTPAADDTYRLPVGYSYSWSFRSANYAKQAGTIDLTSVTEGGAQTIAVALLDKTAWEGEGDISQPAATADGTYQITCGSELAWLAQEVNAGRAGSASAVLCSDIDLGGEEWTPIGKNYSSAFKGSFDGQGHTVSGLSITGSASSNTGLFGYVDSATIENVTVQGSINLTGSGSSSYGAGGIAGQLYGKAGAIRNCRSDVTVHGGQNVGGIVGYVAGGYSSAAKEITGCVNTGAVSSSSHNAGGIVGYIYGQVTVDSCYNRGSCTSGSYRAGGITAYLQSSSAAVKNCYTTGETKVAYGSDSHAVIGNKSSGTVENCYYLSGLTADTSAAAKTADELKALAPTLGGAFLAAPADLNDGYPILRWQVPTYTVTFTVDPAGAEVTIDGQTGTHTEGRWVFALPDGTYSYSVRAFGYLEKTGELTVQGGTVDESVTLAAAARRSVTFTVTPADANAAVTVLWNGQAVAPESDGSYSLPYGDYQYLIKAKGYARASADFTVDESSPADISVELTPSRAWDGAAKEAPDGAGTQAAPYQIESGEQLAWLADTVSAGSGAKICAVLTDDIDLGGFPFAPIGVSSHELSGSFDGQGHTVSGLNVSAQYAGLFGVIKDAEIRNVVVQGTVASTSSGSGDAGGIAGRAVGTTNVIENCGNEANVSGGSNVGGILGNSQNYNTTVTVTGCYNSGSISASDRAGGIIGRYNNSNPRITDCYNTGAVSSSTYAAGILAGSSSNISRCYNVGTITGKDASKTGAFTTSSYNSLTDCYYLTGSIPAGALDNGANAMTLTEMQTTLLTALGAEKWKQVRGVNQGLPILQWQTADGPAASVTLAGDIGFERELIAASDGEETSLPIGKLHWTAIPGAQSYTVSLWQAVKTWIPLSGEDRAAYDAAETAEEKLWFIDDKRIIEHMTTEQLARLAQLDDAIDEANSALESGIEHDSDTKMQLLQALSDAYAARAEFVISLATDDDLGYYGLVLQWAKDISGVTDCSYDCADDLSALPEGIYYASAAAETDGRTAYAPIAQVESEIMPLQSPYNRMQAVSGLRWDGGTAHWDARADFTANQVYRIDLYTVEGSRDDLTYTFYRSFSMPGLYSAANFSNAFAAEKKYAFTVTALSDRETESRNGLTDSITSAFSDVYDPTAGTEEPGTKTWVDIHSAAEWIALANVEDVPSDGTGSPSRQQVEWGKNYRLANDIDFSALTAAEQAKTKSIGTVTYPFMGEFDGQGHKITGLTLSNNDSGLFRYTGATAYVHGLTIEGANVLFSDNAAVLVHNNYGRIENCAVVNTNITADTGAVLGGMVSRNYGVIRASYVQGGTLTSNSTTAVGHAGFVGANEEGGLIERCWTSMSVSTQSMHAAGFVGLGYGGTIRNCFALGDVSARGYSGGFVGRSVYDGNIYENCYAAGTVTVTETEGNGFIGGNQSWSAFQYDQSSGITNCYYNSATDSSHDYNAVAKSLDEMKSADFLAALSGSEAGIWVQSAEKNAGLPYLEGVAAPEQAASSRITVTLVLAAYDKETYQFSQLGGDISVTMDSTGNTRLVDLMDAAQAQGKLTYSYSTTPTFGRFIHTINDYAVNQPDGWMFTINDKLSNVSASLATVQDGDTILWFEGTTENRFQGPTLAQLRGESIEWVDIASVADLLALAKSSNDGVLAKNYRLTADLDLSGVDFPGIGTAAHPFTGLFDGQGHTVTGVTVSGTENVGFFGVIKGATIKNLHLTDVTVTGEKRTGGLVGYAQAELDSENLANGKANLIGSCTISGTVSGKEQTGGLVGCNEGKTDKDTLFSIASAIDKCTADVTVTGASATGGLVGDSSGTVTKSAALGSVTGTSITGGLVGDSSGDIYDSHADGDVSGESCTGGFAGSSDGVVKGCYSLGNVSGTDYTGSFAGAIAKADTVIGAGRVSVVGTPTQGYNGGFAGQLGGVLTGLDSQITVKNAFGNCSQADGPALSVIGNTTSYTSDSQRAALEGMTLSTVKETADKLYELFGVYLRHSDAADEAAKYADTVVLPADAQVGDVLSLLKPGATAADGVTVSYSVAGDTFSGGSALRLEKAGSTATVFTSVELTLTDGDGAVCRKTVRVVLPVSAEKRGELMDTIAAGYTETTDGWTAMDMAAYGRLDGKTAQLTDAARQNLLNLLIAEAAGENVTTSARARLEIVLRSIGADSTALYPANSAARVDNAAVLAQSDFSSVDAYTAPYVLLAALQGNVKLTDKQVTALISALKNNMNGGLFSYEWGGVTYHDPDTAGAALAALAAYYGKRDDATAVVDAILAALPAAMDENGSFGSANSDAMAAIGLLALGKDPAQLKTEDGVSLVDGLLSYVNTETSSFQFYGADNALATEQAFRALAALTKFYESGKAYNVYDFSAAAVTDGRADGSGSSGTDIPEPSGDEIRVKLSIRADSMWIDNCELKLKDGATVYHALKAALEQNGMSAEGMEQGYVSSITKDGYTLGALDKGPNSGWMYQVNGTLPQVTLTNYRLADGDTVLWYYTLDWKTDPDGLRPVPGKSVDEVVAMIDAIGVVDLSRGTAIRAARAAYDALSDADKALIGNYQTLLDAEAAYAKLTAEMGRKLDEIYQTTGDYLAALGTPATGSVGGDWMALGLARSGRNVPDGYYDAVLDYVKANIDENGRLDYARATENARVILALTAIGRDVTDVGGYNLLSGLDSMEYIGTQGVNGPIWALIALDSHDYPTSGDVTREKLVQTILDAQLPGGGWALAGTAADPDLTAMALTALAPYYDESDTVRKAVDDALALLSAMQGSDGGFGTSSEACAQVIVALTALGIDPMTDGHFIKNGLTALDALASFYVSGGGFRHTADGALDGMATEQGYYALAAYYRFAAGQTNLFNMSDVTIQANTPATPDQPGTPANPDNPGTAKPTGDTILLWAILAPAAFLAAAALIRKKKQA